MCGEGERWIRIPQPPPLVEGAIVVEAWATEAVDESMPNTWPRVYPDGRFPDAVSVAGLPVSRFWWDVGVLDWLDWIIYADRLELADVNVDAVEFWECAP
jgi:hypothetical protein